MEADKTKKEIRNEIKELGSKLTGKEVREKSRKILNKFIRIKEFKSADVVFLYVSKEWEVDTCALIRSFIDKKQLYVPRCLEKDELEVIRLRSWEDLELGRYGILEPKTDEQEVFSFDAASLIIVPGIAFDRKGHRIGRGKGCYDKCLSAKTGKSRVWGLCYEFQLFKDIPHDNWDIQVDGLVTEKRILRFSCSR